MDMGRVLVVVQQVVFFLLDTGLLVLQILHSVVDELYRTFKPKEEKNVSGEVAVVTGAGHGIGRDLARQLVKLGVRVACWDINKEGAEETVMELEKEGGQAMVVVVDVSDREAVRNAAMVTRSQMGEVTLLFNNAGIMPCKPVFNYTENEIEKIFAVNVYSQYWTVMEFLPRMISINKGHIVAMCSMAGVTGSPNLVPYSSSKFAVKGLMDALFLEMRSSRPDSKISMTTIHPFVVDTGLAQKPRSRFQKLIPFTPPEEAAKMIISAMRRDHEYAFIPSSLCMLTAVSKLIPRAGQLAIIDFLDCVCEPHDD
eukprot:GFUD01021797.1.p1 GENE.GFUD01021797.1~~GFUD01021797.1.p1  ORF type:complete len:312 (-),score=88.57 GFUD01021797.1:456-1391(-)